MENLAIQGSYGWGTFESYEVRGLYRLRLSSWINPYIGGGYIHVTREADVIGVDVDIEENGYTVFLGNEFQLIKDRLSLFLDVGYSPLELEKDVVNGARSAKAKVDYSPATVGAGIVWYARRRSLMSMSFLPVFVY